MMKSVVSAGQPVEAEGGEVGKRKKAPGVRGRSGEAMDLEWAKTGTTVFVAGLGDLEGLLER
jgi:hypothetical protein